MTVAKPHRRGQAAARCGLALVMTACMSGCGPRPEPAKTQLVVWAWERPEDLRFLPAGTEVAVQTGFLSLSGDRLYARGRRFPLKVRPQQVTTTLVHVQIDRSRPLAWSPELEARTAQAMLFYARRVPTRRVQLDFEVRASERPVLLGLLRDVRRALPPGVALSMTALADWCDTEDWLDRASVDEVVPMLFRMGPAGERLKSRLAAGGDFGNPRCRKAFAVSRDTLIVRAPTGRRVYLFDPRSWSAADYRDLTQRIAAWGGRGL